MINTITDQLKKSFKDKPGVIGIYLIGSFASSNTSRESDFDLVVVVENKKRISIDDIYKLTRTISFPANPDLSVVDLSCSPLYLYQIISRGKILYSREERKVTEFEAKALDNYFDTQHIRSIYYSYLRDKFPRHVN